MLKFWSKHEFNYLITKALPWLCSICLIQSCCWMALKFFWCSVFTFAQDQKKLYDMLISEKEAMYGSKPSPRRSTSFRKTNEYLLSENGSVTPSSRQKTVDSATPELSTPRSYSGRQNMYFKEMKRLSTASLNFVAIAKEDSTSFLSVCCSEPESSPQNH